MLSTILTKTHVISTRFFTHFQYQPSLSVDFSLFFQFIEIHNRFPQPDGLHTRKAGFSFTLSDGCIKINPDRGFYPRKMAISLKSIKKPFACGDINSLIFK